MIVKNNWHALDAFLWRTIKSEIYRLAFKTLKDWEEAIENSFRVLCGSCNIKWANLFEANKCIHKGVGMPLLWIIYLEELVNHLFCHVIVLFSIFFWFSNLHYSVCSLCVAWYRAQTNWWVIRRIARIWHSLSFIRAYGHSSTNFDQHCGL